MTVLEQLNQPVMYLICGLIVLFVAAVCLVFLVRAYRAGKAMGMDTEKMKRTIVSSATFSVLPALGILLGVIALSGSLGIPWPWLRLSVIGALHYETQVASAAAEQVGITLSGTEMTAQAFVTIALLMSLCIMWGMILDSLFGKKYLSRMQKDQGEKRNGGFGDHAMTAMFIGMVSAYLGSYLGGWISGNGIFSFHGSWLPLAVAGVSALVMAVFTYFSEKKGMQWLENFSIAASMLLGMLSAVILGSL
ncbi:MAG: DUF5058 family protein [Clostridia bacterium]|nr:DUF5058 family protein [Clostridia bacterium]